MAYGRVYIENLRNKVVALFDELKASNQLNEKKFIETFKIKYPKDYEMLQYEWEFKIHMFRKNRKGEPKHHPIRPEKILSNMYKNYYFKLIKTPIIQQAKRCELNNMRSTMGNLGYKIKRLQGGKYNIINKASSEIEYEDIDFKTLRQVVSEFKRK